MDSHATNYAGNMVIRPIRLMPAFGLPPYIQSSMIWVVFLIAKGISGFFSKELDYARVDYRLGGVL